MENILQAIKHTLDKCGYVSQVHESISSITIGVPMTDGTPIFGYFSRVDIIDDKMVYVSFNGQLAVEEEFSDLDKLIEHIKKNFPLNPR